ncbi:glycosyltransferase [Actinomadura fulvescens]|uniref:Glycosyltransferase n=1 Tax=Actinomadura fulvescens TaxID=46160 RepID=A0ABN3PIG1_9ACTN
MRVTVLAVGSRGDVQPYLPLGRRLAERGHAVRVAASRIYGDLVRGAGLEFAPLSFDPMVADPLAPGQDGPEDEQRPDVAPGDRAADWIRFGRAGLFDGLFEGLVEATEACAGSDTIVYSHMGLAGFSIAERDGLLGCQVLMHPRVPAVPGAPRHRLRYESFLRTLWLLVRGPMNRWRREVLGLGPLGFLPERRFDAEPTLFAYSPATVPPPRRRRPRQEVTGVWAQPGQPDGWQPDAALAAFLAEGPPPVYVALDRVTQRTDPERAVLTVLDVLRVAGVRAVLSGDPGRLPRGEGILPVADVPHDWLFRRVAAVVHHGGAGTTASALRAGAPAVVLPVGADQPFWADRVAALGAGVALPPFGRAGAGRLGEAIRSVVDEPRYRDRARVIGARMAAEDGVGRACDLLEEWSR